MRYLNTNIRPVEILLVEDNPGDVVLTKKAFETSKISNNINVAKDGEIALSMLRKEDGYSDIITPDIVLLDLNLPKKDGREVLEEIKNDEALKKIPVVVLTSSKAERDILETYGLHANSYILKPVNLEKFAEVVKSIENFWFTIVVYPSNGEQDDE
ncbi:MAG: response regulator [Alphaproteobacteria bacterium CG11_big_fil_rev_8_21_14_0_20_39_49]|nr:MAG: response regulator [Alphaproteobacteria bacterium CG11_big_fil_rev_8_21_14_0_20_39_49]